uniref:ER membrane protein complex subunit 6 n=1 Tax=Ditylum brightwellii TaxID=49249 RepID=A0A6U3NU56_9STRA|mmetsp:Transcript_28871/g.38478  ORF Transcript_28871/g.38478 Transcript_28871/m.38478 type:complete len:128 (+) Transcript_28871:29-412(+)
MIDPMADLAASGPSPDGTQTTTGGEGRDVFDMTAAQLNLKKMDTVRSFMGIVSGCVAGVCGLTGLPGLACFIILHLAVSIALLIKMKFNLKEYTRQSLLSFFTADLQKCGMSFMLFWTLFYGLVYLF